MAKAKAKKKEDQPKGMQKGGTRHEEAGDPGKIAGVLGNKVSKKKQKVKGIIGNSVSPFGPSAKGNKAKKSRKKK